MENKNLECARLILGLAEWSSERTEVLMPMGKVAYSSHRVVASIRGYAIFTRDWSEPIDMETAAQWLADFWGDRLIAMAASLQAISGISDPIQSVKVYHNYFLNDCPLTKEV